MRKCDHFFEDAHGTETIMRLNQEHHFKKILRCLQRASRYNYIDEYTAKNIPAACRPAGLILGFSVVLYFSAAKLINSESVKEQINAYLLGKSGASIRYGNSEFHLFPTSRNHFSSGEHINTR